MDNHGSLITGKLLNSYQMYTMSKDITENRKEHRTEWMVFTKQAFMCGKE